MGDSHCSQLPRSLLYGIKGVSCSKKCRKCNILIYREIAEGDSEAVAVLPHFSPFQKGEKNKAKLPQTKHRGHTNSSADLD